eukprot:TRINITY_DN4501_c0_g1_i3.p1 TRINITY_DN4501_c0_g1~~TRINITY_DN4501_c0_g1_i3.p1  ORF type:complete len:4513 (-),score=1142.54 TRINITY_DN4501_c0_g1_i3:360-11993(-)
MNVLDRAHYLMQTREAEEARVAYSQLSGALDDYIKKTYGEWIQSIDTGLAKRLENPLMIRSDETSLLESGFEKNLLRLFNEVEYWERLHYEIPWGAMDIYSHREKLRVTRENVMLVVRDYNSIIQMLTPDERKLFSERIHSLDKKVNPGLVKLSWASKNVVEHFVKECRKNCRDVAQIVSDYKESARQVSESCRVISDTMLVHIEKKGLYEIDKFEQIQQQHRQKVRVKLEQSHREMKEIMRNTYEVFKNDSDDVQGEWNRYVQKVDKMVEDALRQTVKRSLQELARAINGDGKTEVQPIFLVNVVLELQKVDFKPDMKILGNMVNAVSRELMATTEVVPRLVEVLDLDDNEIAVENAIREGSVPSKPTNSELPSFFSIICNDEDISKIILSIHTGMSTNSEKTLKYLNTWDKYKHIWELDKDAFIRRYAKANRPLAAFETDITRYRELQTEIQNEEGFSSVNFVKIDCTQLKNALISQCTAWQNRFTGLLNSIAAAELRSLHEFFSTNSARVKIPPKSLEMLGESLSLLRKIQEEKSATVGRFEPLIAQYKTLKTFEVQVKQEELMMLDSVQTEWNSFLQAVSDAEVMLEGYKEKFKSELLRSCEEFSTVINAMREEFLLKGPFDAAVEVHHAFEIINDYRAQVNKHKARESQLKAGLAIFLIDPPVYKDLASTVKDLDFLDQIWKVVEEWNVAWERWKTDQFLSINGAEMEEEAQKYQKRITKLGRDIKHWDVWVGIKDRVEQFRKTLPLIQDLKNPALRARHWTRLMDDIGKAFDYQGPDFTLEKIFELGLDNYTESISALSTSASKELAIEEALKGISDTWRSMTLDIVRYKDKEHHRLRSADDIFTQLEDNQVTLSTMKASRYYIAFEAQVEQWEKTLSLILETIELLLVVQRNWMYLENIFAGSEDIRRQLPTESAIFDSINSNWKFVMDRLVKDNNVLRGVTTEGLLDLLNDMNTKLDKVQKSLDQYLETKRQAFPRFYFLSNDDLLEILGQSRDPQAVQPHLKKCFDAIKCLELQAPGKEGRKSYEALGMHSPESEYIPFQTNVIADGPVEMWLTQIEIAMRNTLRRLLLACFTSLKKSKREKWIKEWAGQLLITAGQVQWTMDTFKAVADMEKGEKNALKQLKKKQVSLLNKMSDMVRGQLTKIQRLKLNALLTIEVHARDVIDKLVKANVHMTNDFEWLQQLRFYLDKDAEDCIVRQTNTEFVYGYEYLGNSGRLVITPLTDRCYMTLTTALHLKRGGSPQGPAGTGKTETVKDLGKAIAKYVIVFNCSDGLDYKSLGRMFSGLAQTGAWSCFDEFNRIEIEVLSVVAQQITCILQAISDGVQRFIFEGQEIRLIPSCGIFVTMNPGYAGRSELPDNLKALFRPVAMMVPDSALIAEIMLFSEGFTTAKPLSKKITTLYQLSIQQLSKQDHYDFGLRSVKSILVTAGALKRAEPEQVEDIILLRALRDMNLPKLIAEDVPLFLGIMSDLFPGIEPPQIDYGALQAAIEAELKENSLQIHRKLIHKVIQLYETKLTRHGSMVVGRTCSGKSVCWMTLARALTRLKRDNIQPYNMVKYYVLNPKSITMGELYGESELSTNEWTDGILSSIMRSVSADEKPDEKWIIFDGPVDTLWIESMNTVLDDNKVLTLINGERIAMPPQVSMVFEVEDLSVASPATVSRVGIIYLDVEDLGWEPYVESWLQKRTIPEEVEALRKMFAKYGQVLLEFRRKNCHELVPTSQFNSIASLCHMYDALATVDNGVNLADPDFFNRMVEMWFLFCLIWSVGATVDEASRKKIDMYIREMDGQFPSKDTVYEYFVDPKKKGWAMWEEKIPNAWRYQPETPFYKILVPTVDTIRNSYLLSTLVKHKRNCLFVGNTGTGKTSIVQGVLATLDDSYTVLNINFSAQTSSNRVQQIIEGKLEKRTKDVYTPTGGKKMTVFIDDLNMPQKDLFGSQPPLELIRQWVDYGFWYDRKKQSQVHVKDMQLVASMGPPGGGRTHVSNRLMSRFHTINVTFPSDAQVKRIYETLISQKLQDFEEETKPLAAIMTQATIDVYDAMVSNMLPTPKKSHYLFNMRDISKVFQGMMQATRENIDSKEAMTKLWIHETYRVFHDRLNDDEDRKWFNNLMAEKLNALFGVAWSKLFKVGQFPIFVDFQKEGADVPIYEEVADMDVFKRTIETKLEDYNMEPGCVSMDLVMFKDAIEHVCRIHRIIRQPRGNALLVGVGGSGRQSLSRLATFIAGYKIFQIEITKLYRGVEFHEDLKKLYMMTGVEQKPTTFLFTDTQIVVESFLEDINNMLSSGEVPNLFAPEDLTQIRDAVRVDAKSKGIVETPENLFSFFIERARANLHIVLCMSPVGEGFRQRCRMFPALVNCTTMDWFSEWPKEALKEVALKSFEDIDLGSPQVREAVSTICGEIHHSVIHTSHQMLAELSRHNYVTPTNYLELVSGYKTLLKEKREQLGEAAAKLRNGLNKLDETKQQVEVMSVELESKKENVAKKQKEAEDLLIVIVQERRTADEQAKSVGAESEKIAGEEAEVKRIADAAQQDLSAAMPALEASAKALEALSKKDLAEIKAYTKPPPAVEKVMNAVMVLRKSEPTWTEAKRQLNDPNFLQQLITYDKDSMSDAILKRIEKVVADPEFNPEAVGKVSGAAKSLCMWVIAMEKYGHIFREVAPKRALVQSAVETLSIKQAALKNARDKLNEINERVQALKAKYDESNSTKERLKREAEETEVKLDRAEKLVDGLASERVRWEASIKSFESQIVFLVGDCLVAAAFLSYAGPFVSQYRQDLVKKTWLAQIAANNVPHSVDFNLSTFLAKPTDVRSWNLQGLPTDAFSVENGVVVTRGRRWPLMIDPQGQANKWIKKMEKEKGLKVIDLKQSDYMRTLENAVQFGTPVLLQDVMEELDPSLDPILNKATIRIGGRLILRIGDKELDYNLEFRLYITTKLANPHYSPEICTKTTLVNFAVKEQGLEDQLLGIVVRKEKPELEEQKDQLLISMASGKKKLEELEDEILRLLSTASGSLLDDEQLVNALQSSKSTSEEIKQSLVISEQTELKIDTAREAYRPCAQRASLLFFVLVDMGQVDHMYQFSLDSYIDLFNLSMDKSPKSDDLNERIANLNKYHTYATYRNTCRGLFENHKLLFSFQMCVKILQSVGKVNKDEFVFFLRGGQVIDRSEQAPNPFPDWLSEQSWDNITELDKLPHFRNIASTLDQNGREWKSWYTQSEPEMTPLPGEWENKCNEMQRMIVLRCLRSDRVLSTVTSFIIQNLGQKFVEPPPFDLPGALADSNNLSPLIFILSPGVDPASTLQQLAVSRGQGDRFRSLALGQGQSPIATRMIEEGIRDGSWVFLANCHLSISWMPQLEKIIENLPGRSPHPNFRLWLSSKPHPKFPMSILQRSVKLTTEPPSGLKANLLRLYSGITESVFTKCSKPAKYKKLLFSLCFFHSILLERRKFLSLGWNIPYDFNESDFEVCEKLLSIYLNDYDETPWEALKYLIAEANYGGRVTDELDRRLLRVYINHCFCDDAINQANYRLSSMYTYYIPDDGPLQSYKDYIITLPAADKPEVFGQHSNADIASSIEDTTTLLDTLLSLQPKTSAGAGMSVEAKVAAIASDIADRLPTNFDVEAVAASQKQDGPPSPAHIVLLQEITRYNILLSTIRTSLQNLQKGIKGLVVMSADLDEIFSSLHDAKVPPAWQKAYPSLKPLGPWTRDLLKRVQMFQSWAEGNLPRVFWLSGFTFPTGFLTALLQMSARKSNLSIDSLSWEFVVMKQEEQDITQPPKEGAYVKGLFLEGASWNTVSDYLDEPNPMELVCRMPIIHFKPVESKKKTAKGVYACPLYLYPLRTGTRERPSFMIMVELKSGKVEPDHWIKRGTALLLSLST